MPAMEINITAIRSVSRSRSPFVNHKLTSLDLVVLNPAGRPRVWTFFFEDKLLTSGKLARTRTRRQMQGLMLRFAGALLDAKDGRPFPFLEETGVPEKRQGGVMGNLKAAAGMAGDATLALLVTGVTRAIEGALNGFTPDSFLYCCCMHTLEDIRAFVEERDSFPGEVEVLRKMHTGNGTQLNCVGLACWFNRPLAIIRYLVEELGCDPNCSDAKKLSTPLHFAVLRGNTLAASALSDLDYSHSARVMSLRTTHRQHRHHRLPRGRAQGRHWTGDRDRRPGFLPDALRHRRVPQYVRPGPGHDLPAAARRRRDHAAQRLHGGADDEPVRY
jgi:hypothetical protein